MRHENAIRRVKTAIHNPELTKRLLLWLYSLVRPFQASMLLVFFINVLSILISYASTIVGKYIVDDATSGAIDFRNMSLMCATTAVSILIGIISNIFNSYINEKFSFGIRMKMFEAIQKSSWQEISKIHSGDILTRLTSDISSVSGGLISILPNTLLIVVQFLLAFGILYYYDPPMALMALAIGPVGALAFILFRKKYSEYQKELKESESRYRSFIQECINNLVVMKTFRQEDINNEKLENLRTDRLDITLRNSRLSALMNALVRLMYNIGYVLAFCWGAYRISTGNITYGTLTVFISLVSRVQSTITNMAGVVPQIYSVLVSGKRLFDIHEMETEEYQGFETMPDRVGIEFSQVTFSYKKKTDAVLKNINLRVTPGEKIGIVGESGAGKTTMIRMLLALTKPTSGRIHFLFYDNRPADMTAGPVLQEAEEMPAPCPYPAGKAWEAAGPDARRFISYVPQGNTLLSGTIRENLQVGNVDASEEEMWEALRYADAERFLRKLPTGLDTTLSEHSGGLSEGQAQRISIARALLAHKPLMILDEATSALDEKTEAKVLENLAAHYKDATCFIITHRRSMLQYCDRVVEIEEDGTIRVTEQDS